MARTATPFASPAATAGWWRDAVVYQVYPRSFADSDGDGIGDLPGLVARLPYLRQLGVDAVWVTPFYASPMRDGGYDVADYDRPDPSFGTLADAERLIEAAHEVGLRVLFDIVPNHTSTEHRWFREAMTTPPGTGAWQHYHCVRGRGDDGGEPPSDWRSAFGGPAWSPVCDEDGRPTGWWYLHLFDVSQPDLNWEHPEVRAEHERVLRFWFDRGVDGFRIDVAHGLVKAPGYPDAGAQEVRLLGADDRRGTGAWDQPGVHDIFRSWRALADSYDPPRVYCGEVWVMTHEAQARYLRPDELHSAFNFPYLKTPWDARELRRVIDESLEVAGTVGAPCTWVLSNHDVERHATRLAPTDAWGVRDAARGLARACASTLLMLALPGSAYLYQGEELGLPEVFDLPPDARQDPIVARTGGAELGRDGCRVPLPWASDEPSFGFGPSASSWLPQPSDWATLAVDVQAADATSTLALYRRALALRRRIPALGDGELRWRQVPGLDGDDVLAIERPSEEGSLAVVVNMGEQPVRISRAWCGELLLASSAAVRVGADIVTLAPDTAVWLSWAREWRGGQALLARQ
ncbi:MAG: alpha-glucosidase [Thermoleophilaceae bacterium]|nr:alpha-glucosidase [Thermoleophilaceae bacterium]